MWQFGMLRPLPCHLMPAGLTQDAHAAVEWYTVAAEAGHAAAQNNLGRLLMSGTEGLPADADAALCWLEQAADNGSRSAWFNMGCILEHMGTCGTDVARAMECYLHAAQQQHTGAMLRLGHMQLVIVKQADSQVWFKAAAELGSVDGMLQLAQLATKQAHALTKQRHEQLAQSAKSKDGSGVSQVAVHSAVEAALQLYWHAAAAGSAEAQHVVGCRLWDDGELGTGQGRNTC